MTEAEWKTFYTKVSGVTYPNSDGSDRQKIITGCRIGDRVQLVREPDNQYDHYAVKVLTDAGEQIGYIPAAHTGNEQGIGWCVGRNMDKGKEYIARIADVTGGSEKSYGVNLQLVFWNGPLGSRPPGEPELPPFESQRHSSDPGGSPPDQEDESAGGHIGCIVLLVFGLLLFVVFLILR